MYQLAPKIKQLLQVRRLNISQRTDEPVAKPPDYTSFLDAYFQSSGFYRQSGMTSARQYSGGVNLRKELKGVSPSILKQLEKSGIDLDKNYGRSTEEMQTIRDRIGYLKKYAQYAGGKGSGVISNEGDKFKRSLENLTNDIKNYGESDFTLAPQKIQGYGGITEPEKFKAMRQLMASGKPITRERAAKALGLSLDEFSDKHLRAFQRLGQSEDFQTFQTISDTRQAALQTQKETTQAFLDAQRRVRAPGYAQNAIDAAFAPQETQLNQFYQPQGGATISEAGAAAGEMEAAMGRTGYDRVAAEQLRQQGMARERLASQKSAARQQLQQYIDFNNPAEALRYGTAAGQTGLNLGDYQKNQLLAPYAAVFPMMSQGYRDSLVPFTMRQQVQSEPSWIEQGLGIWNFADSKALSVASMIGGGMSSGSAAQAQQGAMNDLQSMYGGGNGMTGFSGGMVA